MVARFLAVYQIPQYRWHRRTGKPLSCTNGPKGCGMNDREEPVYIVEGTPLALKGLPVRR